MNSRDLLCRIFCILYFVLKFISLTTAADCMPLEIALYIIENALPEFLFFLKYIYIKLYIAFLSLHKKDK